MLVSLKKTTNRELLAQHSMCSVRFLQLQQEHAAVAALHGTQLTPAALAAMPYTAACIKEALRTGQIVPMVPREATQALTGRDCPDVPAGCPFLAAFCAISAADPAVAADAGEFRPERWLVAKSEAAASLALHNMPFGAGQHACLGYHLGLAELSVLLFELSVGGFAVWLARGESSTRWMGFPTKVALDGLPLRLVVSH
jgi:cytochrome P450